MACDCALLKTVYLKWKLKKRIHRIEILKSYIFKYVRCDKYLLHVCWLPINYTNFLNNIQYKDNIYYKIIFGLPMLTSDNYLTRWLLAKFFSFNADTNTYNTQYVYHLIKSLMKKSDLKFCMKAYFFDRNDDHYYEKKRSMRTYYSATALIYVLTPFEGLDFQVDCSSYNT